MYLLHVPTYVYPADRPAKTRHSRSLAHSLFSLFLCDIHPSSLPPYLGLSPTATAPHPLCCSRLSLLFSSSSHPLFLSFSLSPPPPPPAPAPPVLSLLTANKQTLHSSPPAHRSHGHSRSEQARTAPLTLSSCQVMLCHQTANPPNS